MAAPSEVMGTDPAYDTYDATVTPVVAQGVYNSTYASYIGNGADETTAVTAATTAQQTFIALSQAFTAYEGAKLELELKDSFNYSWNMGLLYTPADNVAMAFTFRGRTDADFEGDVKINGQKVTTAEMSYDHPEQIQLGVMVKPVPKVSLELDVVWTNWSANSNQLTVFDEPLMGKIYSDVQARNWNDTNQIRIGAEWQTTQKLALRCGYFYDPSPIPDDTFDIMWPDADRKTYSIGAGYDFGKWTLDASIQLAYAETKRIIGGESDNLNSSYNVESSGTPLIEGYRVETSADGYLMGYGLSLSYHF